MVSTHSAVHIGGGDFMAIMPRGDNKAVEDIEANLLPLAKAALDELVWWANATMAAKAADSKSGSERSVGSSPTDQGLCAIDIRGRHDEVERRRALATDNITDPPVATARHLGDNRVAIQPQE